MNELPIQVAATDHEARLLGVLRIAHDVSTRGEGISLKQALARSGYCELRAHLKPNALLPLLAANPALIEAWLSYSEDKRTSGGWYLKRTGEIGRVSPWKVLTRHSSIADAVAVYAVLELDTLAQNKTPP